MRIGASSMRDPGSSTMRRTIRGFVGQPPGGAASSVVEFYAGVPLRTARRVRHEARCASGCSSRASSTTMRSVPSRICRHGHERASSSGWPAGIAISAAREREEFKDAFVAMVSHELRAPAHRHLCRSTSDAIDVGWQQPATRKRRPSRPRSSSLHPGGVRAALACRLLDDLAGARDPDSIGPLPCRSARRLVLAAGLVRVGRRRHLDTAPRGSPR